MKRDLNLWKLILRQVRDRIEPPELKNYDSDLVVYNSALLVKGGYVDGETISNASGVTVSVVMLALTNIGHDKLDELEAEHQKINSELPMPPKSLPGLSVFVSHSAQDEKLAGALVALLRSALDIPADEIRCTSVNGYRLPIGVDTEERLRQEVHDAKAFIGLITPSSIASAYVMFELGARWGAKLHLAPLLGAGAGSELLRGPLGAMNALNCEDISQIHQLISDLAAILELQELTRPAVYQDMMERLVSISKSETALTKASQPLSQNMVTPEIISTLSEPELSQDEVQVLRLFSSGDIEELSAESITEKTNMHPLKLSRVLGQLTKRKFLYRSTRIGLPSPYSLMANGRDYLIDKDLLE